MKHPTILVVSDKEDACGFAARVLANEGHAVVSAHRGEAALNVLGKGAVEVMITDMRLPDMDVFDLLRAAKELDPSVEVIVLTTSGPKESAVASIKGGGTFLFLEKPLKDADQLTEAVRKALARRRARPPEQECLRSLSREKEWLETVTQHMRTGLAIIGRDYRVLWSNQVLRDLFGDPCDQPCYEFYNQRRNICPGCGVRRVFEAGAVKAIHEQQGLDARGNPVYSEIMATPITDDEGRVVAALEMVVPVTEKKLAEEKCLQLMERLERSKKMEAVATLAGGIAHKFNNLLTILLGHMDLMALHSSLDAPQLQSLSQMRDACLQMRDLTAQLLAYARGGKYQVEKRSFARFVEEAVPNLRYHLAPTVRLDVDAPEDTWLVEADYSQLKMVLSALLANAGEALSEAGTVRVACRNVMLDAEEAAELGGLSPGAYVHLMVRDDGHGMDAATLERAIEPFFSTRFQGRGLGLAAAYGIVRNHGGAIHLESQPGRGTTVHVYLPAADVPGPKAQSIPGGAGTVLFIEDEPLVRYIAEALFQELGHQTVFAETGEEALRILEESPEPFQWVFLDVILPDMHGSELFKRMRAVRPGLRVIVCSGFSRADEVQDLLESGALSFLKKPFTAAELQDAMARAQAAEADGDRSAPSEED
ncbi:Signal transduction histidine kinase [Desulfacinum hydrothermale DSM 13146]|uniref:histidine kinase n=1 Tax=Desulfacinum hydrothermale DSM 13146 TaxID=1121390 RepID=A0A1W1XLE6_9BACT|nr:response regulator [Desulfacinum hydrothermale]SMC24644.1 Signal transduction histidine kinase [Desulfacinum hydrothermale DSM 13146]